MISVSSIVRRAEAVLFSQLDDALLAIDAQQGYVYSLNESAGKVWQMIQEPTAVSEVCSRLRDEYAVDESTCQRSVLALLDDLCNAGLVLVSDAPSR